MGIFYRKGGEVELYDLCVGGGGWGGGGVKGGKHLKRNINSQLSIKTKMLKRSIQFTCQAYFNPLSSPPLRATLLHVYACAIVVCVSRS